MLRNVDIKQFLIRESSLMEKNYYISTNNDKYASPYPNQTLMAVIEIVIAKLFSCHPCFY